MIPNNIPPVTGKEVEYISQLVNGGTLSDGGGPFSQRCQSWLEQRLGCPKAFLTPSGTAALELAALALDIQPGDEVIVPSYIHTFLRQMAFFFGVPLSSMWTSSPQR